MAYMFVGKRMVGQVVRDVRFGRAFRTPSPTAGVRSGDLLWGVQQFPALKSLNGMITKHHNVSEYCSLVLWLIHEKMLID